MCEVHAASRHVLVKFGIDVLTGRWVRIHRVAWEITDLHLRVANVFIYFFLYTVNRREHGSGLSTWLIGLLNIELRVIWNGIRLTGLFWRS